MISKFFKMVMLFSIGAILLTACSKTDLPGSQPLPQPQPSPENNLLSIRLKAAITVGDILYDSIPATFTITSWDANGAAVQKDTLLDAGAQLVYLPKAASRYSLKMQKWGVTYEKLFTRAEVAEGDLYQLGGPKDAKRLQWVTEEIFTNGVAVLASKQHFVYDGQGRINEVHAYAPDPTTGVLRSGNVDLFLYDNNELWVNNTRKSDGVLSAHTAYTFDNQGRTVKTRHQYLTEDHVYTNLYTAEGIVMLFGQNATNVNGSRINLRFSGGNRVEEKTTITGYPTVVKQYSYDFNINPYAVIKMPALYFEQNSKNNVAAETWEGHVQFRNEYTYDADGYVTAVTTKIRSNSGEYVNYSRTLYTY